MRASSLVVATISEPGSQRSTSRVSGVGASTVGEVATGCLGTDLELPLVGFFRAGEDCGRRGAGLLTLAAFTRGLLCFWDARGVGSGFCFLGGGGSNTPGGRGCFAAGEIGEAVELAGGARSEDGPVADGEGIELAGRAADLGSSAQSEDDAAAGGEAVELVGGAEDSGSGTRSEDGPVAGEASVVPGGAVDLEASAEVSGVFGLGVGNFSGGLTSASMCS
jgi:hypothetical protein